MDLDPKLIVGLLFLGLVGYAVYDGWFADMFSSIESGMDNAEMRREIPRD